MTNGILTNAFKNYNTYDDSINYQLIYKTIFGIFNAFVTYDIWTQKVALKSLSVVNFYIL